MGIKHNRAIVQGNPDPTCAWVLGYTEQGGAGARYVGNIVAACWTAGACEKVSPLWRCQQPWDIAGLTKNTGAQMKCLVDDGGRLGTRGLGTEPEWEEPGTWNQRRLTRLME